MGDDMSDDDKKIEVAYGPGMLRVTFAGKECVPGPAEASVLLCTRNYGHEGPCCAGWAGQCLDHAHWSAIPCRQRVEPPAALPPNPTGGTGT